MIDGIVKALTHEIINTIGAVSRGDLLQAAADGSHNEIWHRIRNEVVHDEQDGVLGIVIAAGRRNHDLVSLYGGTGQVRNYSNLGRSYREMLEEMATDVLLDCWVSNIIETEGADAVKI